MGLESVPVKFLLRDGTPGQLSSPNSVTLLPQSPLAEAEHSVLKEGITNMLSVTGLQTLPWYKQNQTHSASVLLQKWEMRRAQAKDSQPAPPTT